MTDRGDETDRPFWTDGDMMFRVVGAGGEPDRLVKVRRPFALLGRTAGADITLDDRAVSARHAYLHLDPRGVYAVDLVTRTGTRLNGTGEMVGWLRPGDWIEVAGRRVELVRMRLNGVAVEPPPCGDDLLADTANDALTGLSLEPRRSHESPWVLGSELVFLGWSASCGIQVKDTAVARTHCALLRSPSGAYLIDLAGRQTWVEDRPVRGAEALADGDLITLGSTQFTARVEPPSRPVAHVPQVIPRHEAAPLLARVEPLSGERTPAPYAGGLPAIDPDHIPAEAQSALLAWVVGTIQGGQGELLRRQGEFHAAMTEALRQIQKDNATLLDAHLRRIEGIDRELTALRAELERRERPQAPPPPTGVTPLRIARPAALPGNAPAPDSKALTTWLLQRVHQLEDENRSAWKDLLGRLSPSRRG